MFAKPLLNNVVGDVTHYGLYDTLCVVRSRISGTYSCLFLLKSLRCKNGLYDTLGRLGTMERAEGP